MSLHDLPPPRKPSRLGLYLPFAIAGLAVVAWTALWIYARGEAEKRMDASVQALRAAGYDVAWKERAIGGYPFRLNVSLTEARVREPSGWALEAPRLEAEARLHAPNRWMIAAPDGATFVRPASGAVRVLGKTLRASLRDLDKTLPSFSFQGAGLTFQPAAGAQPFALQAAEKVEFHLRPGPDDEGGVFLSVEKGKASPAGVLGRVAGARPVAIQWNSTLSRMSALAGRDWPSAVRHWADAGGRLTVRQAGITAGEAVIGANSGTLSVGEDGRLSGVLDVTLRRAPQALSAMGEAGAISPERAQAAAAVVAAREGGGMARATLNFQAGQTTLGPVAIGVAPRVYERR